MPMIRTLVTIAAVIAGLVGPALAQSDQELARTMRRWLRLWQTGRIDVESPVDVRIAAKIYGEAVVPSHSQRPPTHREALELLVGRARTRPTAAMTRALLELAAVGLDGSIVAPERSPQAVRHAAFDVLRDFDSPAAVDALVACASGDERDRGVRVAAVKALGQVDVAVARVFVERRLADGDRLVRLAAAEATAARAHAASLDNLAERLAVEDDGIVLQAIAVAAHRIMREQLAAVDPTAALRATLAAIDALGRADDWRADAAIVELLMDARTARAIPALIEVLDRFERSSARERSPILRDSAHSVLQSLTGTLIPAGDVTGWRAFWERERSGFAVQPRVERRRGADATTTGFFGIPVRGSRIAFVIDVSGSMNAELAPFPVEGTSTAGSGPPATRLQWAKRELMQAVEGLPADARFTVIVFSSAVHRWNEQLVSPTSDTRRALSAMLGGLSANGATNLWGAIDEAFAVSATAYGTIDDDAVDELFLLTDGMPSAGELTDTDAIAEAVAAANRYRRARVHAVSLGSNSPLLRRLAEENGGTFVQR